MHYWTTKPLFSRAFVRLSKTIMALAFTAHESQKYLSNHYILLLYTIVLLSKLENSADRGIHAWSSQPTLTNQCNMFLFMVKNDTTLLYMMYPFIQLALQLRKDTLDYWYVVTPHGSKCCKVAYNFGHLCKWKAQLNFITAFSVAV